MIEDDVVFAVPLKDYVDLLEDYGESKLELEELGHAFDELYSEYEDALAIANEMAELLAKILDIVDA